MSRHPPRDWVARCRVIQYLLDILPRLPGSGREWRRLGITQKTAWFMQQRIREAFAAEGDAVMMEGPVEV